MSEIGYIIEQRRKELGLTLEDVAESVGVGRSTVRKWEKGMIKNMGRDKIEALAKVLQINPVTFVTCELHEKLQNELKEERIKRFDREYEELHQNPRLGLLFDRAKKMKPEDVEFMLQMADRILKERDD